jgi:transcriptional regulator with XRE-family HTH domain
MKTKKSKKTTQSELAAQLGVSRQLLAAHMKKPDAPMLSDLPGWLAYFAQHGRIGSAPEDLRRAIAQERLEILKETKVKLARENKIAAGELILAADVVQQCNRAGAFFCAELDRWSREFPPIAAGRDCAQIAQLLDIQIERTRTELKAKLATIGT